MKKIFIIIKRLIWVLIFIPVFLFSILIFSLATITIIPLGISGYFICTGKDFTETKFWDNFFDMDWEFAFMSWLYNKLND
jgi:hypothetical protein